MKNSFIGLGILSLLFFLSLLFQGNSGGKESSAESLISVAESVQSEPFLFSSEIDLLDGILFGRIENKDFKQFVKKFPAPPCFLFLMSNTHIEEVSGGFTVGLAFYTVKDVFIANHNLRI